jgi:hypothetical protein
VARLKFRIPPARDKQKGPQPFGGSPFAFKTGLRSGAPGFLRMNRRSGPLGAYFAIGFADAAFFFAFAFLAIFFSERTICPRGR